MNWKNVVGAIIILQYLRTVTFISPDVACLKLMGSEFIRSPTWPLTFGCAVMIPHNRFALIGTYLILVLEYSITQITLGYDVINVINVIMAVTNNYKYLQYLTLTLF